MSGTVLFSIPDGYIIRTQSETMPVERAAAILFTRRRIKYTRACHNPASLEATLYRDVWVCPFCGYEIEPAVKFKREQKGHKPLRRSLVDRYDIEKWAECQLSFLEEEDEKELVINEVPTGIVIQHCPKCCRASEKAAAERRVQVRDDGQRVEITAQLTAGKELTFMPWSEPDPVKIEFPASETVCFDFASGRSFIRLMGADKAVFACREITEETGVWQTGVTWQLLEANVKVARTVKRMFLARYGDRLPFSAQELTPDKFVMLTRFVGFERSFYDAIPFMRGSLQVDKSFRGVEESLRNEADAKTLLTASRLPQCRSVRKLFGANTGLLFYLKECEQLWDVLQDVNLLCRLAERMDLFRVLSLLHQRPCMLRFLADYAAAKGVCTLTEHLARDWSRMVEYGLDYCTMSLDMQEDAKKSWSIGEDGIFGENADEETDEYRWREATYSTPMHTPGEAAVNCTIDGFSFIWLRNRNEYFRAGKELSNCLTHWKPYYAPVIAVKQAGKYVAAIELRGSCVQQALSAGNDDLSRVRGLPEAYKKWRRSFGLSVEELSLEDLEE